MRTFLELLIITICFLVTFLVIFRLEGRRIDHRLQQMDRRIKMMQQLSPTNDPPVFRTGVV